MFKIPSFLKYSTNSVSFSFHFPPSFSLHLLFSKPHHLLSFLLQRTQNTARKVRRPVEELVLFEKGHVLEVWTGWVVCLVWCFMDINLVYPRKENLNRKCVWAMGMSSHPLNQSGCLFGLVGFSLVKWFDSILCSLWCDKEGQWWRQWSCTDRPHKTPSNYRVCSSLSQG